LFVERAREVRHGFVLDAETVGPVAQICRRLDGIPLAIELAAARVTSMQPSDIAARLDERFRLLTGGRRTVVERHQTLRATVDWSYELLSDAEQRVFDRLGVFAGGFTLEAAEGVVADEDLADENLAAADVVDILDTLVARSMVALDETATQTRYELLETMRQYARERLDATETADAVRARHAGYFLSFAQHAEPELLGPDEPAWVRRVEADLDNLRAAFTWAADIGDLDVALGIPAAFWWQAQVIPSWGTGRWGEEAASLVGMEEHPLARSVLATAIYSLCNHGDVDAAAECWQRVLEVERKLDLEPDYQSRCAQTAAAAYADRIVEAKELMEQAVAAADRDGDEAIRVTSRTNLAIFLWSSGEHQAAIELAESALRGARSIGNPGRTALALYALAYTLQDDDPARAVACLREQIDASDQLRWNSATGACWMLLCRVEANHGDPTAALESARTAIRYLAETGNRIMTVFALKHSANAFRQAGHPDVAAILLGWVDQQPQRGTAGEEGEMYERQQTETRDELGPDEYDALTARGAAMSYDEIVEYTLQQADLLIPKPTTT
jgi:tetratricopeptide (TPR) repeat protein